MINNRVSVDELVTEMNLLKASVRSKKPSNLALQSKSDAADSAQQEPNLTADQEAELREEFDIKLSDQYKRLEQLIRVTAAETQNFVLDRCDDLNRRLTVPKS